MASSFDSLIQQIFQENISVNPGGNTGISNPNSTYTGTKPGQTTTKPTQPTTNNQKSPTPPNQQEQAQQMKMLLQNPEFRDLIKQTISEIEKEQEQKDFNNQQQNTSNQNTSQQTNTAK